METIAERKAVARKGKKVKAWSDLPHELLELIFSHLTLHDNIRASAVCKGWHAVATSIRVVNQSPWILYFPKYGNIYEFYNPSNREACSLELPELQGSRVCYTKDGWLLLYRHSGHCIFFFNPFTREELKLPRFDLTYRMVAFSCAPTSLDCVVFSMKHVGPTVVGISTCKPGATKWTTVNYPNTVPFMCSIWNKLVFCDGVFYCLSLTGRLGVFDPKEQTWRVLLVPPPKCPSPSSFLTKNWWKGIFMAEHRGDLLVIYTFCSPDPSVFRLDQRNMAWEEVKSLDEMTLFVSFLTSHSRTNVPAISTNSIYFPKVRFYGRRCISYSLSRMRYYPCKRHYDWGDQDPSEGIWIEPPKDLSTFFAE